MIGRSAALPLHLAAATPLRVSAEGVATALILTVQARTGHAATAGYLQTAMTLPYVLSGPVIGLALDRAARPRRIAVALAACYAAATALLLIVAGRVPAAVALPVAAAVGCTEPVVVALTSLLPRFVPAGRLARAYGLEASSYNLAAIAGPGLAAVVAGAAGGRYAGVAIVCSALVGLLALPLLPFPGTPEEEDEPDGPGWRQAVAGGLVVLAEGRVLRAVTAATTLAWTGFGGVAVSAVLLAGHLGAQPSTGGRLLAAMAAGMLLGSLAASRWLTPRHAQAVLFGGLAAFGASLAALAAVPSVPWAVAAFAAAGAFEGPVFAATLMIRQRESPPGRLGQVNTTAGSLKIGASAVGAALTAASADAAGPVGLFLAIGTFQVAGAALGLAMLRRPAPGKSVDFAAPGS
ncbi:MFS transporter [Actinomadura roseirufa]|uniref:MFS transporter n=1 Tax=Actinomadura roseirufa TaxID=2094049 RepID=UPI0013F1649E|nr:MFS transporter [Actinomadura roseirufa]